MLINNNAEYKNGLVTLWKNVFKDEDDYIELLFEHLYFSNKIKVFASFEGKKIISSLYLLDINLKHCNHIYRGFYLYAAATDIAYRQKGIMAKLIDEAKEYAKKSEASFICLVPASKSLYEYYEKFGFQTAMHKKMFDKEMLKSVSRSDVIDCSCDEYLKNRKKLDCNFMFFEKSEFSYALDCLKYYSIKPYKTKSGIYFISDSEIENIMEIFNSDKNTALLMSKDNALCAFGMIYPIDENLKAISSFEEIYMNFALD